MFEGMITITLSIVLIGIITGSLSYLCFHIQCKKMESRQKFLKAQIELENHHYDMVEKQIAQNQRYLDEIDAQIAFLNQYASTTQDEMMQEYKQELLETRQQLSVKKYCCNPILNSVFLHKEKECQDKKINLTLNLQSFQCDFINEADMIGILYNLFDNAIEACEHLENPDERYLTVTCQSQVSPAHEITLEFVNSKKAGFEPPKNQKTWKSNPQDHGFGLEILKNLVKKYHGSLVFEPSDTRYRVQITFPVQGTM